MSDDKKLFTNPLGWILRSCVMFLGAVIALNVAITLLQPILPWIFGGFALASAVWLIVKIVQWQRSRW